MQFRPGRSARQGADHDRDERCRHRNGIQQPGVHPRGRRGQDGRDGEDGRRRGEDDHREQPARGRHVPFAGRDAVARGLGREHEHRDREHEERTGREPGKAARAAALPDAHGPRGEDQDDGGLDQEEHALHPCTCAYWQREREWERERSRVRDLAANAPARSCTRSSPARVARGGGADSRVAERTRKGRPRPRPQSTRSSPALARAAGRGRDGALALARVEEPGLGAYRYSSISSLQRRCARAQLLVGQLDERPVDRAVDRVHVRGVRLACTAARSAPRPSPGGART